jgi:transposase
VNYFFPCTQRKKVTIMNQLEMATIDAIVTLHRRKWSIRRIAKELGIHRDTVARHLQLGQAASKASEAALNTPQTDSAAKKADTDKPEECKIGHPEGGAHEFKIGHPEGGAHEFKLGHPEGGAHEFKIGQAPIGSEGSEPAPPAGKQPSLCEPWRQVIVGKLEMGLTAQRIYQDLVNEHGFSGKYHSVRRYVHRLNPQQELPFRRLECAAGEEAQVDFGTGIPIDLPDGKKRRTHVFRIVLSHSRKGYSEAVFRQTTDDFLGCLENAFVHFGGVPKVLVLDNLKAGVETPDWFDPELNPKLRAFADHYGLAIMPTRPRMPRHKGKIESGVKYVKGNGLKGLRFSSLEDENRHLLEWETTVADVRIHGTIRQQVAKVFADVERAALQPLPVQRFPFFHEAQRKVHRDGHVEVAKAYYSVPPEHVGATVWARWDGRVVRIFNGRLEQIALHAQREPGRFSTHESHLADEKMAMVEKGAAWMLTRVRRLGDGATRWAEAMMQARGVEGVRVLQGLLSLAKRHTSAAIDRVCAIAITHGAYRLRTLRELLKRKESEQIQQGQFGFMSEHPLIRPLSDYEQLIHDAFRKGGG